MDAATSLGQPQLEALSLSGWLALARTDVVRATGTFTQISDEFRCDGNHRMAALQMFPLAISSLQSGDAAEAVRRIDVAVAASREFGAIPWLQNSLMTRAYAHVARRNLGAAAEDLVEALEHTKQTGTSEVAAALAQATATTLAASNPDSAVSLLAAAESLPEVQHMSRLTRVLVVPALEKIVGGTRSNLRSMLDSGAYDSAWTRGAGMDTVATVALVSESLDGALGQTI